MISCRTLALSCTPSLTRAFLAFQADPWSAFTKSKARVTDNNLLAVASMSPHPASCSSALSLLRFTRRARVYSSRAAGNARRASLIRGCTLCTETPSLCSWRMKCGSDDGAAPALASSGSPESAVGAAIGGDLQKIMPSSSLLRNRGREGGRCVNLQY